jgi:hypothetical protein
MKQRTPDEDTKGAQGLGGRAHERVDLKPNSLLPETARPKPPEVDTGESGETVALATSIGDGKKQDIPPGMIDEATDLLATIEGEEAVEHAKIAAERNRRMLKETD